MKYLILFAAVVGLTHAQSNGTIRLVQNGIPGNSYTSGIVQVYYDEEWSGICQDDSFGNSEADVICHQLGYTGAQSFSNAGNQPQYGSIESTNYTDVQCSNEDYLVLFQCSFTRGNGCNPNQAVTVNCANTRIWDDPYTGQVRLQRGTYSSEGLVEVYCNDQWGTICGDGFGDTEADVVCNQLGYNSAIIITSLNSTQPVWLRNVDCSIFTNCLTSCQSCPSSAITSCLTSGGVSVECSYDSSTSKSTHTVGTCDSTDLAEAIGRLIGIIVGVIVGICALIIFFTLLPFCICCCLGVGIGAAASRA